MARNKFDYEAAAKTVVKAQPFPEPEAILPFGDPRLGPVYKGVLWTETKDGWQLAWAKVQGSEAQFELFGEPEPKVFTLARLQAEVQKRFVGA